MPRKRNRNAKLNLNLEPEWDLDGIDAEKQSKIDPGFKYYTWTPFPIGLEVAEMLCEKVAFLNKEGLGGCRNVSELIQRTKLQTRVLHATAGAGGSTIALGTVFQNVHAGDFCPRQLKALRHNIDTVFPSGGPRPTVDEKPVNACDRDDYHAFDAVVIEPCWGGRLYQESNEGTKDLWTYKGKFKKWMFDHITEQNEKGGAGGKSHERVYLQSLVRDVLLGHENVKVVAILVPFNFDHVGLSSDLASKHNVCCDFWTPIGASRGWGHAVPNLLPGDIGRGSEVASFVAGEAGRAHYRKCRNPDRYIFCYRARHSNDGAGRALGWMLGDIAGRVSSFPRRVRSFFPGILPWSSSGAWTTLAEFVRGAHRAPVGLPRAARKGGSGTLALIGGGKLVYLSGRTNMIKNADGSTTVGGSRMTHNQVQRHGDREALQSGQDIQYDDDEEHVNGHKNYDNRDDEWLSRDGGKQAYKRVGLSRTNKNQRYQDAQGRNFHYDKNGRMVYQLKNGLRIIFAARNASSKRRANTSYSGGGGGGAVASIFEGVSSIKDVGSLTMGDLKSVLTKASTKRKEQGPAPQRPPPPAKSGAPGKGLPRDDGGDGGIEFSRGDKVNREKRRQSGGFKRPSPPKDALVNGQAKSLWQMNRSLVLYKEHVFEKLSPCSKDDATYVGLTEWVQESFDEYNASWAGDSHAENKLFDAVIDSEAQYEAVRKRLNDQGRGGNGGDGGQSARILSGIVGGKVFIRDLWSGFIRRLSKQQLENAIDRCAKRMNGAMIGGGAEYQSLYDCMVAYLAIMQAEWGDGGAIVERKIKKMLGASIDAKGGSQLRELVNDRVKAPASVDVLNDAGDDDAGDDDAGEGDAGEGGAGGGDAGEGDTEKPGGGEDDTKKGVPTERSAIGAIEQLVLLRDQFDWMVDRGWDLTKMAKKLAAAIFEIEWENGDVRVGEQLTCNRLDARRGTELGLLHMMVTIGREVYGPESDVWKREDRPTLEDIKTMISAQMNEVFERIRREDKTLGRAKKSHDEVARAYLAEIKEKRRLEKQAEAERVAEEIKKAKDAAAEDAKARDEELRRLENEQKRREYSIPGRMDNVEERQSGSGLDYIIEYDGPGPDETIDDIIASNPWMVQRDDFLYGIDLFEGVLLSSDMLGAAKLIPVEHEGTNVVEYFRYTVGTSNFIRIREDNLFAVWKFAKRTREDFHRKAKKIKGRGAFRRDESTPSPIVDYVVAYVRDHAPWVKYDEEEEGLVAIILREGLAGPGSQTISVSSPSGHASEEFCYSISDEFIPLFGDQGIDLVKIQSFIDESEANNARIADIVGTGRGARGKDGVTRREAYRFQGKDWSTYSDDDDDDDDDDGGAHQAKPSGKKKRKARKRGAAPPLVALLSVGIRVIA